MKGPRSSNGRPKRKPAGRVRRSLFLAVPPPRNPAYPPRARPRNGFAFFGTRAAGRAGSKAPGAGDENQGCWPAGAPASFTRGVGSAGNQTSHGRPHVPFARISGGFSKIAERVPVHAAGRSLLATERGGGADRRPKLSPVPAGSFRVGLRPGLATERTPRADSLPPGLSRVPSKRPAEATRKPNGAKPDTLSFRAGCPPARRPLVDSGPGLAVAHHARR